MFKPDVLIKLTKHNHVPSTSNGGSRFEDIPKKEETKTSVLVINPDYDGISDEPYLVKDMITHLTIVSGTGGDIDLMIDTQANLNARAVGTNIYDILKRFTSGDLTALNFRKYAGVYGDFTDIPKTPHELHQRLLEAQDIFDHLPIDIKQKYHNNVSEFVEDLGTEHFASWYNPLMEERANASVIKSPIEDKLDTIANTLNNLQPKGDVINE